MQPKFIKASVGNARKIVSSMTEDNVRTLMQVITNTQESLSAPEVEFLERYVKELEVKYIDPRTT